MLKLMVMFSFFMTALNVFASVHTFKVVDRNKKFKTIIHKVVLKNFTSKTRFEGSNFKIVEGKNNDAIKFTANKKLLLKAATTYFHLEKAKKYFIKHLESSFVKSLSVITIRLNFKNSFNKYGKYANDNLLPQYNNAVTIPKGKENDRFNIEAWDNEIWFRPSKSVNINELGGFSSQITQVKSLLSVFRNTTHQMTLQRFLTNVIMGTYSLKNSKLISSLFKTTGSSLITELAYQTTGAIVKIASPKWYMLETALVPEIIYHEFSHLALSDEIDINISTPINEGLADYFAGQISRNKELAAHTKYNSFAYKKVDENNFYQPQLEAREYANADFVFSLLTLLTDLFEKDQSSFIYNMRKEINPLGTIRDELTESLLVSCSMFCNDPEVDIHKLRYFLYQKGF